MTSVTHDFAKERTSCRKPATSGRLSDVTVADGRVGRGTRNREAIVDALLACYEAGVLRPSVPEVAQRQWQRFAPLIGSAATVDELVEQRAAFYEAVTPVRRAALLSIHDSPAIARNLARLDRLLRRQLEATFPALTSDAHDALELVTSWDAWNRLRTAQGCSVARARRVVTDVVRNLTEGTVT